VTLVFKSPRDISNIAGGGDDMFGFTTAVKNELKKLLQPFKNELMKHLKKMGDTVEANKKGTEWQMAIMKNAVNSLAKQTDALKDHNDEIHSICRELLDILPNPVPLVKEEGDEDEDDEGGGENK
jgi:seryl-tRNA synthetase